MRKIDQARQILKEIGMPKEQQTELCCLILLAMSGLRLRTPWRDATNEWVRIHDVIALVNQHYKKNYAENSRETFRKQGMHHFRLAALIEDNGTATNSPNYRYRLTVEALDLLKSYGTKLWKHHLDEFLQNHKTLIEIYASKKKMKMIPVKINHTDFCFSAGDHNQLQKVIIEQFAPRFAPMSECLYVGDTTKKDLVKHEDKLHALGFEITQHDKMPDVVLYREEKHWLYFVEAVTSVGAMTPKRVVEIKEMAQNVSAGKIFVTAFLDFPTYKAFSNQLAWETEVWIAAMPDHMIHLNGDRFLGPHV